MTSTRLAAIQRDLGLHPTVVGKPGRPGAFAPVVVAGHWTAVRSSAGNPHPSLAVVRDGRRGLPGPLYGDLVPYQTNPDNLRIIQISVGRSNNLGMCHRPSVLAAGRGQTIARRPPADTAGGNDLVDAVSADYHPAQGPPPAAMVEAMVRAIAARLIYRGLPAHAVIDHAQATARKVDLLDHWPQPAELRARVAAAMTSKPPVSEEDDVIKKGEQGNHVVVLQWNLNELINGRPDHEKGIPVDGNFGTWTENAVKLLQQRYGYAATGVYDLALSERVQRDLADRRYATRS